MKASNNARQGLNPRTTWPRPRLPRIRVDMPDKQLAFFMVLPAMTLTVLYVAYPLWTIVSTAFMSFDTLTGPGRWVGLLNFRWLLSGDFFLPALGRSLYYTLASVVLQTVFGFAMAMLLDAALPGRGIARSSVLLPLVVSAVVTALVFAFVFAPLNGIVNYLLMSSHLITEPLAWLSSPRSAMNSIILVSVWKYSPISIILFLARLQTLPIEVLEAAKTDGANPWQLFRYIVLPWMAPILLVVVLLRTILSFNEYDIPFLLTQGGPGSSTLVLPVLIKILLLDYQAPGRAAAVAAVMIAILAILSAVYFVMYRRAESALE